MNSTNTQNQKVLPQEGFVQMWVLINDRRGPGVFGVCRTVLFEGMKDGRFPAPIKRGRTNLWRVEDVRQTIANMGGVQ